MSQQTVVDFFTQAENDSTLKEKLQAVANKEDLLRLAQESGYSFTADELKVVAKNAESDELNEEELEAVAGGGIKQIAREVGKTIKDVWHSIWG